LHKFDLKTIGRVYYPGGRFDIYYFTKWILLAPRFQIPKSTFRFLKLVNPRATR